ncbi:MAG: putative maturation protein [Alehxovirus nemorisvivens]|uniref:Maturation protein n=1 Tax=Leviviridae sp. TaxID=2027243 RepID=A0ABY3SST4_9VIRU|nr:MAG: putative maturation protein [Leviviridae sp.]
MPSRNRVEEMPFTDGGIRAQWREATQSWIIPPNPIILNGAYRYRGVCDDTIGSPGVAHPLTIEKKTNTFLTINGMKTYPNGDFYYHTNYVPVTSIDVGHLTVNKGDTLANDFTRLYARTNPNRATVMGAVSIAELRDLPRMVKLAGESILKNSAGGYLSWTFGWAPLLDDLRKLLDFNGAVDRKVKELHRLYSKGGLRRRMTLHKTEGADANSFSGGPGDAQWVINQKITTQYRKWGTVRWYPTSLPPKNEGEYRRLAIQLAFGLDVSASTVWNVLPWTWLIDWFSNVGDYLEAYKNTVPVTPVNACIMQTTRTRKHSVKSPSSDKVWEISHGQATRTSLQRTLGSPSITASIPFLTGRQLSILSALAITRLTR